MLMTPDCDRQKIAVFIVLVAAVAAALLMGYDSGSWITGALGYVAWSLMPYAFLLGLHFATCTNRLLAFSARETTWSFIGISIAGPLLYIDIRYLRPDAQGAIAMLMVPVMQCAGILFISTISLLWYRFQNNKANRLLSLLNKSAVAAFTIYLLISALQYSDAKTIDTAKEIDFFITKHCQTHGMLPTSSQLHARFPGLTTDVGWYFFTDDASWLKMQYPVRWSNSRALGKPQASEFTATTYSYIIEYRCVDTR
ncbi:MAG: hypothetical protein BroJett006_28500 [Betaproteobacteria bacterium]|jgi:hypothetical protein|nr:MAG: hypothetical protein BroJett006_28500 [Betaproteobacteria bacterium]